jgi:hypothetical protein
MLDQPTKSWCCNSSDVGRAGEAHELLSHIVAFRRPIKDLQVIQPCPRWHVITELSYIILGDGGSRTKAAY